MNSNQQWKILLVEDDQEDYLLTRDMLAEAHGKYQIEWVSNYETARHQILNNAYDAILMDYNLGLRSGLELTREVTQDGCKAPIILLTGHGNYEIDLQAMQIGATDYLSKNEATPASLERTLRYAILQKSTEEALRSAKEELETRVQERTAELQRKNQDLEAEITERVRVEAELAEVQRHLLDRTEAERRELARDLHDGPMQDLYGLIFQLETMPPDFSDESRAIKEKLLQVIHSLRTISRELRPPSLTSFGLQNAIRSHAEALQKSHPDLKIKLQLDADGKAFPEPVRLSLFRIYQTAITNVMRHARADQATVRLKMAGDQARLEIQDNGCGFNVPKRWIELARQGHLGLVGAAERAEAVGGKFEVESQPGKGTVIRVIIPLKSTNVQNQ